MSNYNRSLGQSDPVIQAQKKLCEVYGENCLTERQCQHWFARFGSGNFNVQGASHTGRPITIDNDKIKALVEANRCMTSRKKLNISNTTVSLHLKKLGYVSKLDVWVPHELKEIHLTKRINIYDSLLNRNQNDPLLKRVITGDEKWILSKLNEEIKRKPPELANRKGVLFHHDNAICPYVFNNASKIIGTKLGTDTSSTI
ncbi:histone-lysine N-methyltransferase SETMAR-like [Euwallacea fornicatus]|uniref:histone-lysine N-methyltransferase SETMAR-like n=1 Tax=Euwallacea fornicatus TaxID=995702 RepID=UPI00338E3994